MSVPLRYDQLDPTRQSAISANIAKMRSAGAPDADVETYLTQHEHLAPVDAPAEKPGLLTRAGSMIAGGLTHMVTHPIDTATQMIEAPVKSLFTATVAPGVGENRPDARLSKGGNSSGRAIDTTPYDAEHGGVTTRQRTEAGVQSVVNAAAPVLTRGASKFLSPDLAKIPFLGTPASKAAPLATIGAAEGAAYNPNDPLAGALAGGAITPIVGAAVKGTTGAVQINKTLRRVRAAEPLGETVAHQNTANEFIDRANYGDAEAEGKATPTSPAVRQALDHPRVKPYVDAYRASDEGANASDATTAREALKLMSRDQRSLEQKMEIKGEYDAQADMKARDLKNARRMLKAAVSERPQTPQQYLTTPGTPERPEILGPQTTHTAPPAETAQSPAPDLRTAINDFHSVKGVAAKRVEGTVEQQKARQALERHSAEQVASPSLRGAPPEERTSTSTAFSLPEVPNILAQPDVKIPYEGPRPLTRSPAVMPSLPNAINEHARTMGNRKALNLGADQTRRILNGAPIAAKRLDTQGGPAFLNQIATELSPEQAEHATKGVLGRTNEMTKYHAPDHHATLTGIVAGAAQPLVRINKMRPYLEALDQKSGAAKPSALDMDMLMRNLGLVNAGIASRDSTP